MAIFIVTAHVTREATFTVEADNEDQALDKVREGEWTEEDNKGQVTEIEPLYGEEEDQA